MLNQPEFQSGRSAQDAAEVLDDDSITRLFHDSPRPAEVRVVIGQESHDEHLRPYSVVYATYGAPERGHGRHRRDGPDPHGLRPRDVQRPLPRRVPQRTRAGPGTLAPVAGLAAVP